MRRFLAPFVLTAIACDPGVPDDASSTCGATDCGSEGDATEDELVPGVAGCFAAGADVLIVGIPGASDVSVTIEGGYALATDVMVNHAVHHDFLRGSWSVDNGFDPSGGECYPMRLAFDEVRKVLLLSGFTCTQYGYTTFAPAEILCPSEF